MKISWQGFLAKNHSWSLVSQSLCREFIKMGHQVDMFSTNGEQYFPQDLKSNLVGFVNENDSKLHGKLLDKNYDMQLSYTAFKNFPYYFNNGNKNRFGIWNYETTILPKGFSKAHLHVDKILPSSNFSKEIFTKNGIPESSQVVVPHGVDINKFNSKIKYPLKTNKKYKILANIAQPHVRKNIKGLLNSYGKAFNKKDDVSLIIKIYINNQDNTTNFNNILSTFKKQYPNHGEIIILKDFIVNIEELYNAVDIVFTMSHAENWWLPGLEGFASNKIVIAPNYGGQLDFMNKDNSFLIDGKIIRAPSEMQYWEASPYAACFDPDQNQAAQILKDVISNYDSIKEKFVPNMTETVNQFTWNNAAAQIIKLCK